MTTPFPFTSLQVLTAAELNNITNLPINDQTASYVAVAGDAGKRIVMNVATANTVTIDDSVFAVGDTIFISTKDAATTVTAGAGVTINTAGSLVIAQHGGGTLVATSASVFTFFSGAGNLYGVATGGTSSSITVGGVAYTLLEFASSSTLTVTKAGLFDCLVVGGGGGGGNSGNAGGGGAGGVAISTLFLDTNATITIGGGGASLTTGQSSLVGVSADSFRGVGGGYGGGRRFIGSGDAGQPGSGASTGGAGSELNQAGSNVALQGSLGGSSVVGAGGGGGGFSAVGANGAGTVGGNGGAGFDASAFKGEAVDTTRFAGGGGGGGSSGGSGGVGGGGNRNAAGSANTGGGGGGLSTGGSGIILVRFEA